MKSIKSRIDAFVQGNIRDFDGFGCYEAKETVAMLVELEEKINELESALRLARKPASNESSGLAKQEPFRMAPKKLSKENQDWLNENKCGVVIFYDDVKSKLLENETETRCLKSVLKLARKHVGSEQVDLDGNGNSFVSVKSVIDDILEGE